MIKTDIETLEVSQEILGVLPEIKRYIDTLQFFEVGQVRLNEYIVANFLEYETSQRESRVWEAHKKDYDIHYMYCGEEAIDVANSKTMEKEAYCEEDDYYLLHGMQEETLELRTGDILIFGHDEAHRTGIGENNRKVQKIVFKIRML